MSFCDVLMTACKYHPDYIIPDSMELRITDTLVDKFKAERTSKGRDKDKKDTSSDSIRLS